MSTITLNQTCRACPEQYDAVDEAGNVVGYLRLRHGYFSVQLGGPDGPEILSAQPEGDGIFTEEERPRYLNAAVDAIQRSLAVASPEWHARLAEAVLAASIADWDVGEGRVVEIALDDLLRTVIRTLDTTQDTLIQEG